MLGAAAFAFNLVVAGALHPRPPFSHYASFARWLVHESDYAVVSTHHAGTGVFGNIISISDGDGYEHSTGLIYTFLPDLDATYEDLMVDSRVALTFTEKALAGGASGGCANSTAENPPCGRLTISGRLTLVPKHQEATALQCLYERHPEMRGWGKAHNFRPFWLARENITDFFLIDMYGGAVHPTVDEYFAAPWRDGLRADLAGGGGGRPPAEPLDTMSCSVCGHAYDPANDGNGKPFGELPDSWTCPVCGAPKSAFKKQASPDGSITWLHA